MVGFPMVTRYLVFFFICWFGGDGFRSEVGEFIVIEVGKIGFLVAEQRGFGAKEIGSCIAHGHEVEETPDAGIGQSGRSVRPSNP